MEDVKLLIYAGIAVIVLSLLVLKIVRERAIKAKGRIEITLDKSTAKLGETIDGIVVVSPLKQIHVDTIELTLKCSMRVRVGSDDPGHGRYSEKTLYKATKNLRQNFTLHANLPSNVPLSIAMPGRDLSRSEDKKLRKHNTKDNQRSIHWTLQVEVQCKGVNLNTVKRLVVPYLPDNRAQAA